MRCRRGLCGIDKVLHEKSNPDFQHRSDTELAADFGALGYPGFGYLRGAPRNPAEVLFDTLDRPDLDARLVEALPWLPLNFPNMNWDWLISQAKLRNRQNRLGFVIALAARVAERQAKHAVSRDLYQIARVLDDCRLAKTDTLCQESWPPSQRKFARKQRSPLAVHWRLDTRLSEKDLAYSATEQS
jgi:hypothetical protein